MTLYSGHVAQGASYTWKGATNSSWELAGNWTPGTIPSTGDTAVFNGVTSGVLQVGYTFGTDGGTNGVNFLLTGSQTSQVGIGETAGTGGMRVGSITMASGAGTLLLGGGAVTSTYTLGSATTSLHTFTNLSANSMVFGTDIGFGFGGGGPHTVNLVGGTTTNVGNFVWGAKTGVGGSGSLASMTMNSLGTLTFTGITGSGTGQVAIGTINLAAGNTFIGNTNGGTESLTSGSLLVGSAAAPAAIYQSGSSTVANTSTAGGAFQIGAVPGAFGYYNLTSGTINAAGEIDPGGSGGGANTFGQFDVFGGTVNLPNSTSSFLLPDRGAAGEVSVVNISGGTIQIIGSATPATSNINGLAVGLNNVGNLTSTVTVANGGQFLTPSLTAKLNDTNFGGTANSTNVSQLNLNNGTFQVLGFGTAVNAGGGNGFATLNFNGGTLKAGTASNTSFMSSLGGATIYAGGGTINNNGQNITINQAIAPAVGSGLSTVGITAGGSGYITPPEVIITGGGGSGATAYATINAAGSVTGIVVTNPGVNYSGTPTVTFSGGFISGATAASVGAIATAANTSGNLTLTGSGITSFTGTTTFTGATNLQAGQLTIAGSGGLNGSSAINVSGATSKIVTTSSVAVSPTVNLTQGTVDGTGTFNTVVASANTTVANGNGGSATLNIGSLGFAGAGTMSFTSPGGANTASLSLNVTTLSTAGSPIMVNVTPATPWANNVTYDLAKYITLNGNTADFVGGTIAGLTTRQSSAFGVDTVNDFLTLSIIGDSPKWTGLDSSAWQVGATGANKNWKLVTAGTPTDYIDGDTVLFDDTATGTTTVSIGVANVSPSVTTFANSSKNYILSGAFGIAGAGSLQMTGTGTLTVINTNTYTGATIIGSGATLALGDGTNGDDGQLSATTPVSIASNGTLLFNRFGAVSSGFAIGGAGGVVMSGAGTQTLTGTSTYTGGTVLNSGVLAASADVNLGASASSISLNGGTLKATAGFTDTHAIVVSGIGGTINVNAGTGQLYLHTANTLQGSGPLTLTGSGVLTANSGNLRIDVSNSYSGAMTVTNGGIFEYGTANAVAPAATFNVPGQGEISVNAGVSMPNAITINNATNSVLSFENGTTGDFTGPITLNASATIGLRDWYNNATLRGGVIDGTIGGTGGLTVSSGGTATGGTLTLNGSNTYSGGTTIVASKVLANNSSAMGSGSVTISGTGAEVMLGSGVNVTNPLTINAGAGATSQGVVWVPNAVTATYSGPITINTVQAAGGHFATATNGLLVLSGPITSPVPVAIRTGTVNVSNTSSSYASLLVQSGTVQLGATNAIPTTATISLGSSGASTFDMASYSQSIAGLSLAANTGVVTNSVASSTSTLTMTGTSTFAGSINDGAGHVALTVASGSQFTASGTGSFAGNLTVNGTLLAGTGIPGTPATPIASSLGDLSATRSINVNNGGVLSLTGGNVLGTGGSANTLSGITLVVNQGGVFQTGSQSGSGGFWNKTGPITLNGGTIHVGTGANTTNFQALALAGDVTVTGSNPSLIDSFPGASANAIGIHLGQNGTAGQNVTFNVADVTGDANTDLTVTPPLLNTSSTLTASGLIKSGLGTMVLKGSSTYSGTTAVNAGVLQIGDGATDGQLAGTTSVTVADSSQLHLLSVNSSPLGSTHELNTTASVAITNLSVQTQLKLDLGDGVETIGQFSINSIDQGFGYFGSSTFFASHPDLLTNPNAAADEVYFSGDGAFSVPEPSTVSILCLGGAALLRRRRRKARTN